MSHRYIVRSKARDHVANEESEILNWLEQGHCGAGDYVFLEEEHRWIPIYELPSISSLFLQKPSVKPEKPVITVYKLGQGKTYQAGPFTVSTILAMVQSGELAANSWIFVEGDTDWRQVKQIKLLKDALPQSPTNLPKMDLQKVVEVKEAAPLQAPVVAVALPSNHTETNHFDEDIPEDEQTKAVSKLGLAQETAPKAPPTAPPLPSIPPIPSMPNTQQATPASGSTEIPFDGLIVEIPQEPMWLIKQNNSERISGPFPFEQVYTFLNENKITKEDKISKQGTNRFTKISQQYEFNVPHTIETVVEGGVEKRKILIKRRHPRVPYIADVQISRIGKSWRGKCVNISAGGILFEAQDFDLPLGEQVDLEIMPSIITQKISVRAMLIGKIPKKPPGFAFQFVQLAVQDKEAIEFFISKTLEKEKAMGM